LKKAFAIPLLNKLCVTVLVLILHLSALSQCSNSLHSISYDTLIAGSGNDNHTFSIPKFNPLLGTLISAKVNSVVSVNYGFVLKNVESVSRNFSVSVGRYDDFASAVLASPYSNQMQVNIGTYPLNPGNTVSQGLTNIIYRHSNTDSLVTNLTNFMGSGSISFDYEPITYTNLIGSANYYYSASASDTVHFSITYLYCNPVVLPVNLSSFRAERQSETLINLSWTTENEAAGRNYEVQKSNNGNDFVPVSVVPGEPSNGGLAKYGYDYTLSANDHGVIYFRLKQTDQSGAGGYSEIRMVKLDQDGNAGVSLFPNPATNFVDLRLNQPGVKSWVVDIFSSNGGLVQTSACPNAGIMHVLFKSKPARGVYFIRATDPQTHKSAVQHFVVD